MRKTRLDSRFFESTRGKIVMHLRFGSKTVNELVALLGLTDNAIRANLLTLERDHLVTQTGSIKGFRKPHFSYSLTHEARELFPKSYDSLFNGLVSELKSKLGPAAVIDTLRSVGRRFGIQIANKGGGSLDERIDKTLSALEELGGAAKVIDENEKVMIKSDACPFADAVSEHPEVCQVAEAMIREIVGVPVKEACDRTGLPKCCFEIMPASQP
jgi:predicted ArsR family transcriptional regulator